jgi:sugar phosphate permease
VVYDKKPEHEDTHRWVVFGVISSVYFLVYFHRVSTSVIAPDLLAAFQTHATALGFMSSMYFYPYALEQPLVGYLTDLLGPRRVVGLWSLVAAFGCFLFGLAPSLGWAVLGRGLIGFGVGGVYVPAMKAFSQWFQKKDFATMTGLLLAAGNLGAILATTPLAWMAHMWGWRSSFFVTGGVTLGVALVTFLFVRDREQTDVSRNEELPSKHDQTADLPVPAFRVLASVRFWILAAIFFGFFGVFLTFQGLWATPFLMSILELDRMYASNLNLLIPVGFIFGAPLFGWLTDRVLHNKIHVLIFVMLIHTLIWAKLTFAGTALGTGGMVSLLLVMGCSAGGFGTTFWALVRETTPEQVMGITSGLINPAAFLGVAIIQVWTGTILDRVGRLGDMYPPAAYAEAFLVCLLIIVGCVILCTCFSKKVCRAE